MIASVLLLLLSSPLAPQRQVQVRLNVTLSHGATACATRSAVWYSSPSIDRMDKTSRWTSVDASTRVQHGVVAVLSDAQHRQSLVRFNGATIAYSRPVPAHLTIRSVVFEEDEQEPAVAALADGSLVSVDPYTGNIATLSTFNYSSTMSASYWDRRSHRVYAQVDGVCKPHWATSGRTAVAPAASCLIKFDVLNGWLIAAHPADGVTVVQFADWHTAPVPGTALAVPALLHDPAQCGGALSLATFNLERGGRTPGPCTTVPARPAHLVTSVFTQNATVVAVTDTVVKPSSTLNLVDVHTGRTVGSLTGTEILRAARLSDGALLVSLGVSLTAC